MRVAIGMMVSAAWLLSGMPLSAQDYTAQLEDKEYPVSDFNSISVEGDFEVTLAQGSNRVRVTVDQILSPYIQVYVRSRTLYLTYDSKSVPKDVRKLYKGKKAPNPVFRAVVYIPELSAVSLTDNASLTGSDEFFATNFELNVEGKAQLKSLSVHAESAQVLLKKNAQAVVTLEAEKQVSLDSEGSSNARFTIRTKDLNINNSGSSSVVITGECDALNVSSSHSSQASLSVPALKAVVNAEGSSKLVLEGDADRLEVRGTRSSQVDANNFPVHEVVADLSGSSHVTVTVDQLLDVNLVGGSVLYFNGTPEFRIGKIVKSTLAPFGTR